LRNSVSAKDKSKRIAADEILGIGNSPMNNADGAESSKFGIHNATILESIANQGRLQEYA